MTIEICAKCGEEVIRVGPDGLWFCQGCNRCVECYTETVEEDSERD